MFPIWIVWKNTQTLTLGKLLLFLSRRISLIFTHDEGKQINSPKSIRSFIFWHPPLPKMPFKLDARQIKGKYSSVLHNEKVPNAQRCPKQLPEWIEKGCFSFPQHWGAISPSQHQWYLQGQKETWALLNMLWIKGKDRGLEEDPRRMLGTMGPP